MTRRAHRCTVSQLSLILGACISLLRRCDYVMNKAYRMSALKPNVKTWFSTHDWSEVRPQEATRSWPYSLTSLQRILTADPSWFTVSMGTGKPKCDHRYPRLGDLISTDNKCSRGLHAAPDQVSISGRMAEDYSIHILGRYACQCTQISFG